MRNTARALLAIVGLFFFVPGLMLIISPDNFASELLMEPGAGGLSHIRALLGGAIAAIGLSTLIAAISGNVNQARVAVLYVFFILVARAIGLFVDGPFEGMAMYFVFPMIALTMLIAAHKLLNKADDAASTSN